MQRYGLIGYPVSHSLSPRLFEAAYGGRFRYDLLEYVNFDDAFRLFIKSYDSVNVTAPFKEQAYGKAKIRSLECELTGAANILVKTPRGLSCFNSDCSAVKALIDGQPVQKSGAKVLVVGCGGAGKAAIVGAVQLGLEVTVMNRSISRALAFVQSLNAKLAGSGICGTVRVLPIESFSSELAVSDILIYTAPSPLDCFPFRPAGCAEECAQTRLKVIIEANYRTPSFSPEVLAGLPQAAYVGGEQWLLQQALTGYRLMSGIAPDSQALVSLVSGISRPTE